MIDISKYSKARVLMALYNASCPQSPRFLYVDYEPMTGEQAEEILSSQTYFDYLSGRVIRVNLNADEIDPRLYDLENGEGAALRAISAIELKRSSTGIKSHMRPGGRRRKRDIRIYWYKFIYRECVMGDSYSVERRRVYGVKPNDYKERHIYEKFLCGNHY